MLGIPRYSSRPSARFIFCRHCVAALYSNQHATYDIADTRNISETKAVDRYIRLQQIVDSNAHNNALAATMYRESTHLNNVFASNVFYVWRFADDFDQWLACIPVLIDVANVS